MHLLLVAVLSLILVGVAHAGRELSIAKQDGKRVVIKAKGKSDLLWFAVAIQGGIPSFEIKGNTKDEESSATSRMQLTLANVFEEGSAQRMSLAGTQAYWSDIQVQREDSTGQISLRATMVHPDKDIAGDHFTVLLEATVHKDSDSFLIRPMIQNYPYSEGKGKLLLGQAVDATAPATLTPSTTGQISAGDYGAIQILLDSAIEDGNPEALKGPRVASDKGSRIKQLASDPREFLVEFNSIRPKNATFVERLTLNPHAVKIADQDDKKVPPDNVKGMSTNGSASHHHASWVLGPVAVLASLLYLL